MHRKIVGTLFTVLIITLLYTFVPAENVQAQTTTRIYIDPPAIIDDTLTPNDTFAITVLIENIPADPGLAGLQFEISWDDTVLNGVSMTEELFSNVTPPGEEDNIWKLKHKVFADHVEYAYTYLDISRAISGGYLPISGNYTVAIVTLKVVGIGQTNLDLYNTKPSDPVPQPLPHTAEDGYFKNSPPAPPAELYVDPSRILNLTLTPCHNFTVNINIANASDVYYLEFKLGFDTTIVHATDIDSGDFIPLAATPTTEINNTAGYVWFSVVLGTSKSGNGTLATITFHVEGLGKTTLDLYETELLDVVVNPLAHTTSDGSFNNILLAKLAVDPDEIIDPSLLPPSTFTINITIADVEDLYGYEFNLTYSPDVLICLMVTIHDVLNETNYYPNLIMDNTNGYVKLNVTYYPPAVPITVTPPTPLATLKFRVRGLGATNLTLTDTALVDSAGNPIPHETYSGYFLSLIRDIAVIDVFPSPAEIYEGQETNITVTVRNEGNISETFDIEIYYESTLITTITVINLAPNANTTETITWDTTGVSPGYHTISAEVPEIPFEIDTGDNVFIDGILRIKIMGDLNGDDVVDILDAVIASTAFGSRPGDPNWNPEADLNGDGEVDILDMILLSKNFGKGI